jgi:hypothetical protein
MQPGGLRESSRWSDPDLSGEDHRYRVVPMRTLKGCQTSLRILGPSRVRFPCFPVVFSRHIGI